MKYAVSALAGSLASTVAVVLAGHWPAILLVLGFVTATVMYTYCLRLLGVERYTRWFYAGSAASDRLGKISGEVFSSYSPAASQRQISNRMGNSERSRPGPAPKMQEGDGRTRPVGNAFRERGEAVPPSPLDTAEPRFRNLSERERGKAANNSRPQRRAPKYNNPKVLPPIQQDVLSALMNLGCTFREAEQAVRSVSDGGESFDQLFRKALDVINSGKVLTRKAVA